MKIDSLITKALATENTPDRQKFGMDLQYFCLVQLFLSVISIANALKDSS